MINHVGFFVVVYFSCNFSFHELGAEMLLLAGLPFLLFFGYALYFKVFLQRRRIRIDYF